MKPIDILDALSDLPEEYTVFAAHSQNAQSASEEQKKTIEPKGGIVMKKNQNARNGESNFRFSRAGIAAAVALCIGLNAAMIFGISRMKQDSGSFSPAASPEISTEQEETAEDKAVNAETEASAESSVQRTDSLSSSLDPIAEDQNTDTASADTVTVPDFTGMDWETAKTAAKEAGFLPSKMLCEPNETLPGTVTYQIPPAGEDMPQGTVLRMHVAKKDGEQDLTMKFSVTEPHEGVYYFCVRNEAQEIIGITFPYKMNMDDGETTKCVYPDCSEENAKAEAYLVNYETKQEALIGSYILHPETGTYDTISEDMEAAFRQIE